MDKPQIQRILVFLKVTHLSLKVEDAMNQHPLASRPHAIPGVIAALALFAALGGWPYGYYPLLRLVVSGAGIYTAFVMYGWRRMGLAWLFGLVALLFNPIVVIHLSREMWRPIDLFCAALFAIVALTVHRRRRSADALHPTVMHPEKETE